MDGSEKITSTKCPRNKSRNGVYADVVKDGHLFFGPQCGGTIGSSRSSTTLVGMEV